MALKLENGTIGNNSVNFIYNEDKHVTFQLRQYESYKKMSDKDHSEGVYGFKSVGESLPFNHNV